MSSTNSPNALKRREALRATHRSGLGAVLFLTEISWAGDLVGSGVDFSIVSGLTDDEAIKLLRSVQRKNSSRRRADLLFPGVPARAQSRNSDAKARGMATPKRGMENNSAVTTARRPTDPPGLDS
jgi:hypothetical protein